LLQEVPAGKFLWKETSLPRVVRRTTSWGGGGLWEAFPSCKTKKTQGVKQSTGREEAEKEERLPGE